MHRRRLPWGIGRSDAPGAAMLALLGLAVALPGTRRELLALATLAAAAWVAWDAVAHDRPGPRARLVMAFGLMMLAALPALLLAFDPGLWARPPRLHGLDAGLALWSVGIAAVAVGARTVPIARGVRTLGVARRPAEPSGPRGTRGPWIVAGLVVVSLAVFVHKVGGPVAYFRNLNHSAATNAGLTYLIWGISCAKYAAFAWLGEAWATGRPVSRRVGGAAVVAMLLLVFLGSRLIVLISLIQLLVLYAALRPVGRRFVVSLGGAAVLGAVVFIGLGEYRRWENVTRHRRSFPSYFVHRSLPGLPRTYVNNYVDTVRSSVLARQIVPARAPYEYGKELLRVLLQPIPGSLRPTVTEAPALRATFTGGHHNGNALPLPVEGYIEFGVPGDLAFCLILGLTVGLVDRFGARTPDVGWLTASIAAGTGLVIAFRGSLHNGIAIAGIDVIGFFVVHRILYRRRTGPEP